MEFSVVSLKYNIISDVSPEIPGEKHNKKQTNDTSVDQK